VLEKLGFVGFGEAAYHLAKGLREAGVARTFAYDINTHTPAMGERIQSRARDTGTELMESSAGLAGAADVILSAVTADQAVKAAHQTAPYLAARHLYADINSVSPSVKQAVGLAVTGAGARFVEVAVMAAVPPYGHKVPMLLGGAAATEFEAMMTPLGMRMEVVSTDQIGRAVAVKMFRSVIYKGLEALIFECVLGASHYGAEPRVFASFEKDFPGVDFKKLADYMIGRVVVHGERRAREMEEVAATLRELGIDPIMAEATARRMDWAAKLDLRSQFGGEFPKTYADVLEAIRDRSRETEVRSQNVGSAFKAPMEVL
jgi:3-hydroxyisobutyrate dehydrogenase-like beta-hydroxyacid dehydrogenase